MKLNLDEFCREIVDCLIEYGNIEEKEATQMVSNSHIVSATTDMELNLLFHEMPYYWAMSLLYAKENQNWYQDPKLWPPPQDYIEKWHQSVSDTE